MDSTPPRDPEDASSYTAANAESFKININFTPERFSEPWTFTNPPTLDDIIAECQTTWPQYDWTKTKAIPGPGKPTGFKSLLKSPDDDDLSLLPLNKLTIKLLAPKTSDLASLRSASAEAAAIRAKRATQRANRRVRTSRINAARPSQQDTQYTFQTLRPLPFLHNPQRSLAFLERLRDDPGIRAAMRKHQFSVGLLTEMDPSQYTESTHEGTTRILGLNRNRGEVIELRLRTDAYDGYRDYKTIRKTLCHELAHNVHGDHDRAFWDLTKLIEKEVAAADYRSGGRSVGGEEYAPEREGADDGEEEEFMDHGGWSGGTYVLGGGGGGGGEAGLTRREILARAAEQRLKRLGREKEERRGGSERDGEAS